MAKKKKKKYDETFDLPIEEKVDFNDFLKQVLSADTEKVEEKVKEEEQNLDDQQNEE